MRDRAILAKFLAHRIYMQDTQLNSLGKIFPLSKNGGHFEFSNFGRNYFKFN